MIDLDDNEPRAELVLAPQWLIRLYNRDLGLICRALGGRMTPRDYEDARELGDRLTALQANGARDLITGREIAVRHMEEARTEDGLDPNPLAKPPKPARTPKGERP